MGNKLIPLDRHKQSTKSIKKYVDSLVLKTVETIQGTLSSIQNKLIPTGGSQGQTLVKKTDSDHDVEWGPRVVNKNLLINSTWMSKNSVVNRQGLDVYDGVNIYTIDKWKTMIYSTKVELKDDGLEVTPSVAYGRIVQTIENEEISGQTVTFSILIEEPHSARISLALFPGDVGLIYLPVGFTGLYSLTATLPSSTSQNRHGVQIGSATAGVPFRLKAAKLELGLIQTLAHKEGDVWTLNEIPNYAEQYAICEQYSVLTGEFIGNQCYNKSLLMNGYFVNPVNRNGQLEYIANYSYTIDRYIANGITVTIGNDGLTIKPISGTSNRFFAQRFDLGLRDEYGGKRMTFSIIDGNGELHTGSAVFPASDNLSPLLFKVSDWNFALYRYSNEMGIRTMPASDDAIIKMKAAKLEFGFVQTLAHKEGNKWILNEIPNYAEQYAICEQYNPITGNFIGSQHSNPQLLDNAHFANKASIINQHGADKYSSAGISIDRWNLWPDTTLQVLDDAIKITKEASGWAFGQKIDNGTLIKGYTYTFSILAKAGGNKIRMFYEPRSGVYSTKDVVITQDYAVYSVTFVAEGYPTDDFIPLVVMQFFTKDDLFIKAAKLEPGPVQTLAHKEGSTWVLNDPSPNKALELAKCQGYVQKLSAYSYFSASYISANSLVFNIPLVNPLRASPTIDMSNFRIVSNSNNQSGYTFGISNRYTYISIQATKVNHGLQSAMLVVDKDTFINCNI